MERNKIASFKKVVWAHYRTFGRHDLPWRKTHDPYKVLVSEVMLQQTQVERVIPFYAEFMRRFPTVEKLAKAPLSRALVTWQGLGYNRRAKQLHEAAKIIVSRYNGTFPAVYSELVELPGIGPYTARAVLAFAYNENVSFVETNIRTAVIRHFFAKKKKISDAQIEKILMAALPKGKAREWNWALMDYGAFLKRSGVKLNGRSLTYVKQSKFKGSLREARGAILRALAKETASAGHLTRLFGPGRRAQLTSALAALRAEGFVEERRGRYRLQR